MYILVRDGHQQGDNIGHVLPAETMLLRMESTTGATMGIWQEMTENKAAGLEQQSGFVVV